MFCRRHHGFYSIEETIKVFDDFAGIYGLKISLEKSTFYLAGLADNCREEITSCFPFAVGTLPVRYLGLPLVTKRLNAVDYEPLLEKIKSRMSSWTARYLSYAGRLLLLNSVIASTVNYWMSSFRLPNECIKRIDSLCSAFLWSGPDLNPKKRKWHGVRYVNLSRKEVWGLNA